MNVLTERVARSFRRSGKSYDVAAEAQRHIAQQVFQRLCQHRGTGALGRVLEAGYGSGHLTRALSRLPIGQLWLNDLTAPQLGFCPEASYLPGDILNTVLPAELDLVASTSMIQWLPDPAAALAHLCRAVRAGGWLALSGFAPGHFPELRALGSAAPAPSYLDAGAMAALLPPGWQLWEACQFAHPLWFASPLAVLHHLRATGVNGCARAHWTRAGLRRFCDDYGTRFGTGAGVPLTYLPALIIAQKH
jgi:malonyl-CoA O-methyltransferase